MKTEHKFKIGSYYRRNDGVFVRLDDKCWGWHREKWESEYPGHVFAQATRPDSEYASGYVSLIDGRYVGGFRVDHPQSLLPGELDAQGNPITEQSEQEEIWSFIAPTVIPHAEPERPRRTWADSKPADRWDGYTVRSWADFDELTANGLAEHTSPLQRLSDSSDPLHGSAFLKG